MNIVNVRQDEGEASTILNNERSQNSSNLGTIAATRPHIEPSVSVKALNESGQADTSPLLRKSEHSRAQSTELQRRHIRDHLTQE